MATSHGDSLERMGEEGEEGRLVSQPTSLLPLPPSYYILQRRAAWHLKKLDGRDVSESFIREELQHTHTANGGEVVVTHETLQLRPLSKRAFKKPISCWLRNMGHFL